MQKTASPRDEEKAHWKHFVNNNYRAIFTSDLFFEISVRKVDTEIEFSLLLCVAQGLLFCFWLIEEK